MPLITQLKRLLVGSPLESHRESHERMSIPIALAVFASDALSSTAYATEEILLAIITTAYATHANGLSLPVALAIVGLMAIVVISYRQVIRAYPQGGGSYQVAREHLGPTLSQVAGAALLIDYVLTASVSVSAGVAAFTSTGLLPTTMAVPVALGFLGLITLVNLRGVKESGIAFAIPAYIFLANMVVLLIAGAVKLMHGPSAMGHLAHPAQWSMHWSDMFTNMGLALVLLNAFSHGCAALTGIEAISNGVKAFREPVVKNANRTMVFMGAILAAIFVGMTLLAYGFHILPSPNGVPTVTSQIVAQVFGDQNPWFYFVQFSTMVILILAANTSFAGFPRLTSILAHDGCLPRQLMSQGDRLVFSNGIIALGVLSGALVILYHANTHAMMPLYAVGVFLSFTLAQWGMVKHHQHNLRQKEVPTQHILQTRVALVMNAMGGIATAAVTGLLMVEKFTHGAWLVLVAGGGLITLFRSIQRHYKSTGRQLALPDNGTNGDGVYCPVAFEHTALVLVASLNRGTIPALEYAKSIGHHIEAVHVCINPEQTERLKENWETWGCGIPLTILESPYRSIVEPLVQYIDEVENRYEHDWVTVVVPEFVTRNWWHALLHNQTAFLIKSYLYWRRGKIVTSVRYYLGE